jgi:hypothetical protein
MMAGMVPETSITMHAVGFCSATFPVASDLGYILGSLFHVPLQKGDLNQIHCVDTTQNFQSLHFLMLHEGHRKESHSSFPSTGAWNFPILEHCHTPCLLDFFVA